MDPLTRLVHLGALAAYAGTTLALVTMILPALEAIDDPKLQRRVFARAMRPYNVISVGALGVSIISGASALTTLKAAAGPAYANLIWPLAWKLTLTFVLVMAGTWVSFGIAHRLVRADLGDLPVEPERQQGMLRRLRIAGWTGIALALATTWAGIGLGR